MGKGTLTVETRVSDEALPVRGAEVTVSNHNGTVYHAITDESGKTVKFIDLEAPDASVTLDPNIPGPHYGLVDVTISAPGFATIIVNNVQIFDGIDAVLPVHMLPGFAPGSPPVRYDIPQPRVEDPGEHDKQGAQTYVLSEVIIPDYITVHLGTPSNTAARNVRVPFRDYIKNVTSSEIYPTWPNASLMANIHAIVTFALNRVYTEWYRSRGYTFDITNSTAYDMAFVEGRDIFTNISQLVDEYFNTYARRAGHRNPYFTEFCNGTTVTCSGMSQWGTVPLANQGYSPIQILRHFYPDDLELSESDKFQSIIESYPGTALREGSSGESVERMQRFLNRIRANYPLIPQISNPNGYFGPDTTAAVKVFQNAFNLTSDGIIGKATWYKISYIYVAVTKLAELDGEGERIGIGSTPPTSVLRLGSRGADVVELQFLLNFISAFFPSIPSVIPDSIFGVSTQDAVREFQKLFGLTADGIVGPTTWNRLYTVYKNIESNVSVPPGEGLPPYPGYFLRVGSTGESVRTVQNALNLVHNGISAIPSVTVDGIFGTDTHNSVLAFQRHFGLTADGIVGSVTWNALMSEAAAITATPKPPVSGIPPFPGVLLRVGSVGESVRSVQEALNIVGTAVSSIPRVTVDGIFGNETLGAVIAYQRHAGLTPDGIVGEVTWNRLMQDAVEIESTPPSVTPPPANLPPFPGFYIALGSVGNYVLQIQRYLNDIARRYTSIPTVTPDSIFGPATRNAVIAFQRQFGLTPDGIVGQMTWNKIMEIYYGL